MASIPCGKGGEVCLIPKGKEVNAVYAKMLRIAIFVVLFAGLFLTYAK